jgi:hypothetical protein
VSLAYLYAISAQFGLNIKSWKWDDGIDLEIGSNKPIETEAGDMTFKTVAIGLQVKATKNWEVKDGQIAFPLKAANYERLRKPNSFPPEYLVLYTLPLTREQWVCHRDDHTDFLHRAYFADLSGQPALRPSETGDFPTSKTVYVPTANVLTGPRLLELYRAHCVELLKLRRSAP